MLVKPELKRKARDLARAYYNRFYPLLFSFCLRLSFHSRLISLRRFRLFHLFLGFLSLLGTGFSALLALFIQHLLTAQEFDEGLVGAIALLPSGADNARIAPGAVAKARPNGIEQFVHGFIGHEIRSRLAARRKISALAQGDHLLDNRLQRLGFGNRSFNPLFDDERSGHIPQQRAPMRCSPSEFESSYSVAHGKPQLSVVGGQLSVMIVERRASSPVLH